MARILRLGWRPVFLLLASLAFAQQPPLAPPESRTVAAQASFNGEAFTYTSQLLHEGSRHRTYALTYPSPLKTPLTNNNQIPAEYYVPNNLKPGDPRRPAVICLHILNGNFELERMLCTALAESGVPAIMFKLPYYGERSPVGGRNVLLRDASLFTESLKQAVLDVRRTVDLLSSRPEVDPARIGVTGISLGAILTGSACGAEPRLQRAVLILGGGDLRRIMAHARESRGFRESLAKMTPEQRAAIEAALDRADPLAHAAALRRLADTGRLMMINAAEDEVIPPDCTRKLAEATGMKDKVIWLEGMGHYTALAALPKILNDTVGFFGQDLPSSITAPVVAGGKDLPPLQALASFLQQTSAFLTRSPAPGRCHYIALQASTASPNGKTNSYQFSFVRGENAQFRLTASPVPELKTLNIGCGEYPWMLAKNGKLFSGRKNLNPATNVSDFIDPQGFLKLQLLAGAASAFSVAPQAFAQYLQVTDEPSAPGERVLALKLTHKKTQGSGQICFQRDTMIPQKLSFSSKDIDVSVTVRLWSLEAVSSPELYRPPDATAVQDVPRQDLLRMFAAAFNFLIEKAQ